MFTIEGKFNIAYVYASELEATAYAQILSFLNNPAFANIRIAIMADAHAGKGCVIGFTSELSDKVVPFVVGVDQGCAVTAWKLGKRSIIGEPYDKLDKFIRENIPSGRNIREHRFDIDRTESLYRNTFSLQDFPQFVDKIEKVAKETEQKKDYVMYSLGSCGGGNHFLEIDRDEQENLWLIIHSGSRNFGSKVAEWHQRRAENKTFGMDQETYRARVEEIKATKKRQGIEAAIAALRKEMNSHGKKPSGLEYLEGKDAQLYYEHLQITQMYAQLNRRIMGLQIIEDFFKLPYSELEIIESIHNYINFKDRILRKGAISAHAGEKIIIPLNMADGVIIGEGRGDPDWNYSAPHGAGRKMSRKAAKEKIDLKAYEQIMRERKVWTSCVGKNTLDEAPQAYKKAETILEDIKGTVNVTNRMWPTYNFKASE